MNIAYNNAFAETLFIIKCLPYEEQNKISPNFIEFLEQNKNNNYVITINPNIGLQNQKLLEETKELLKEIYMSYFISEDERNRITRYDNYLKLVEENLKSQKHSYNDIFKDKEKNNLSKERNIDTVALIEYKETIFKRILNKIKDIFRK